MTPRRKLSPIEVLYLRHRLAGATTADIARRYHVPPHRVTSTLYRAAERARAAGIEVRNVPHLLILAAYDGVLPLELER